MLPPLAPDVARQAIAGMDAAVLSAIVSRAVAEAVSVVEWTAVRRFGPVRWCGR